MARGAPDATGRSSSRRVGRRGEGQGPPKGEPWVWLTAELMRSPAWRARSEFAVKLLEFLMVDHMAHAGYGNGALLATYDQLVAWGIPRKYIKATIDEVEDLGLVTVINRGRLKEASTYELTWLPNPDRLKPINSWRSVSPQAAEIAKHRAAAARQKSRGTVSVFASGPSVGHLKSTKRN